MLRRVLIGVGIGLAASALAVALSLTPADDALEAETYDWRVAATATPASDSRVAVIEINESSLQALDPIIGRWPWPRLAHASIIDFLTAAGARVVAYDVLFAEEDTRGTFDVGGQPFDGPLSDLALVDAVARSGRVVLAADATFEGLASDTGGPQQDLALRMPGVHYAPGDGFQPRRSVTPPFESLLAAAAGLGHTFLALDPDGSARRIAPFVDVGGTAIPSLGVAAALAALEASAEDVRLEGEMLAIGDRRMPLLSEPVPALVETGPPLPSRQVLLGFHRPVVDEDAVVTIYPAYSFFDVLLSQDQMLAGVEPAIDPEVFRDKVVFVGTTAAGLKDVITTPFDDTGGASGVLVHATIADNILENRFMARADSATDLVVTGAMGLAAGVAATTLPVTGAVVGVVALAGLVAWGLTMAAGAGVWVAAVPAILAAALALFGGVSWRYFVEDRAKRQVKELFGRYVSKDVIRSLLDDPDAARLGGHRREMSVLFSDIRGFTTASEAGTPEEVVAQLNEYFSAMVAVLFRHHGTLDKFVGDMVMGLFGAPLDDPRHADHAVAAALEMSEELARLNEQWASAGRPPLDIGIGINSGEMVAGNIGSESIMSYTVIGDAVNLGARIESLNKDYGTRILISEATRDQLTSPVGTRRIGEVTVKGRARPVVVYEVTGRAAGEQES